MAVKIQFRRDTAVNWQSENPILAPGELGLDLTNYNFKIGDGTTGWNSLLYARDTDASGASYINSTSGLDAVTVQAAIDELAAEKMDKTANLSDLSDKSAARTNLDVYSKNETNNAINAANIALGTNYSVANLSARGSLTDLTVGDVVFVMDDGDEKWASYKVTAVTDGSGSTSSYIKIMDEDIYLQTISANAILETIKTVDGSGSGLNADILDGIDSASFARVDSASTFTTVPAFNGGESGVTSPFTVNSTTLVTNLNADLLDGQQGSYYKTSSNIDYNNTTSGLIAITVQGAIDEAESRIDTLETATTAANLLTAIKTVDGVNSGLDADLLDGQQGSYYTTSSNINYDNTLSALSATNVKGAIDEVEGRVENLETATTAANLLTAIKTVDGVNSGLDADLLDGKNSSDFVDITTDQTIGGNKTFSNNVSISGNLTVSGSTTFINTTELQIGDNLIELNADLPANVTPTENAGILVNRGIDNGVALYWDESDDTWSVADTEYAKRRIAVELMTISGGSY